MPKKFGKVWSLANDPSKSVVRKAPPNMWRKGEEISWSLAKNPNKSVARKAPPPPNMGEEEEISWSLANNTGKSVVRKARAVSGNKAWVFLDYRPRIRPRQ